MSKYGSSISLSSFKVSEPCPAKYCTLDYSLNACNK